jgi:hypothetical protein
VNSLQEIVDRRFRAGHFHRTPVYPDPRGTLEGLSYAEVAGSQKMISLEDAFLHLPGYVEMAFHESLLRITANFLGYIPPVYQGLAVRDFPHNRPKHSSNFHKDNNHSDSLQIFIYLQDVEASRGFQIYVPGSHRHDPRSCRPRLSSDVGRDEEVKRIYPQQTWVVLQAKRGSVGFISGNGIHKGPAWPVYGDPTNQPRTALRIDVHGLTSRGAPPASRRMRRADYDRLSPLQRLFTTVYELVDQKTGTISRSAGAND